MLSVSRRRLSGGENVSVTVASRAQARLIPAARANVASYACSSSMIDSPNAFAVATSA